MVHARSIVASRIGAAGYKVMRSLARDMELIARPALDAPSFLPVEVTTTEVSFPAEPVSADGAGRIEIALASGHRLTLSGAFDADVVLRLARGLAAP